MSGENKGNTISKRSKLWMEQSLLKLMQKENYYDITVQEITDNADLSRRTFYRNYSSKDEILEEYMIKIWKEYEMIIREQTDFSMPNVAVIFFTLMKKHLYFLKTINRFNLIPLFVGKLYKYLNSAFYEIKGNKMSFSKESIRYALTFSMGGFTSILIKWLDEGAEKSPDEMSEIVKNIISIGNYPKI